jgi:hypothetical protein
MKPKPRFYFVQTPECSLTWLGTTKPDGADHVWLCTAAGDPLLRVPRANVSETTAEATAARLAQDRPLVKGLN